MIAVSEIAMGRFADQLTVILLIGLAVYAGFTIVLFIAGRRHAKQRMDYSLQVSRDILKDKLSMSEDNYWEYDPGTRLLKLNPSQSAVLGQRRCLYLQEYIELVHPDERQALKESFDCMISGCRDIDYQQYRVLGEDGRYHAMATVRFAMRRNATSRVRGITGFSAPVGGHDANASEDLKAERRRLMERSSGAGYWEINKNTNTVFMSESAARIFYGEKKDQEMQVDSFIEVLSPGSAADFIMYTLDRSDMQEEFTLQLQAYIPGKNQTRHIETFFRRYRSSADGVSRIMAMSIDITPHIEKARNESYLAHHDEITGLYNRRDFNARVRNREYRQPFILVMCDFDGLKLVNDIMGHNAGDEMIRLLATALRKSFPESYIARIGGDEFAVVCRGMSEREVQSAIADAEKYCRDHNKHYLDVDISCGYCTVRAEDDFSDCFVRAENMLYHYKLGKRSKRKQRAKEMLLNQLYLVTSETGAHGDRVGLMASMILKEMDYHRAADERRIKLLGQLHDIGKLLIPRDILEKQGKLTEEEWTIMRNHPKTGFKIVSNLVDDCNVAESVLYHHERWDGKGYPYGVEGNKIPIFARVLAVVNAYDTMTHRQPYREPVGHDAACREIIDNSGTQFDPEVVEAFIRYMNVGS